MSAAPRWLAPRALDELLARLAAAGGLVAPVRVDGEVLFVEVGDPAEICRDYVNAHVPPKEHLLPPRERLLAYRVEGGRRCSSRSRTGRSASAPSSASAPATSRGSPTSSASSRAASSTAPTPPTTRFMRRREATTLISVVCGRAGPTCMCVCGEGGPALERGYDWQLTGLPEGWLVEIGSGRGERLAARHADLLAPAPEGAAGAKAALVAATVEEFRHHSMHRVPTMAATRMVSAGELDAAFWRIVGDRCLECGGCAYLCPTCWCFNVVDLERDGEQSLEQAAGSVSPLAPGGLTERTRDGSWERVRVHDNCMLAGFVRQAGGGYPRLTCGERCLTRFFHKLSQQFHERMGAPGCTGCGRCVAACLGEEGIAVVAEAMRVVLTGPGRAGTAGGGAP